MTKFFHMTPTRYAVGQSILANGADKVDHCIENELEARRPSTAFARRESVYCLDSTDFTICGIVTPGYIYRVKPNGEPQRRDFAWIGEMQKSLLRAKYPQYEEMKKYPEWNVDLIEECCTGYWSGTAMQMPG